LVGQYRLGIVDVPGHERFVRNMLAGATGLDLALLVVAADDSVKPQTREHLDILRLLQLEAGVIAVTKCDLVEPDWLEMVEEEIGQLVHGTFLAAAPRVRTSVATGQGLEELREQLAAAARSAGARQAARLAAPFRMAIDRSFTMPGYGTVVTGSVSSGSVKVGDELVIEPGGHGVRVRGLQNHDRTADEVHRGQRAAINLAGIHHAELRRGQELSSPGHLVPSRLITIQASLISTAPRPLKNRSRVRVHVGTAELLATAVVLGGDELAPGQSAPLQLFLNEPAVTVWGQPLVLRSESPVVTIGGGVVLDPQAEKLRKPEAVVWQLLADLQSPEPLRRASAALYFAGLRDWRAADLTRTAGIDQPESVAEQLRRQGDLQEIPLSPTRKIRLHRLVVQRLAGQIEAAMQQMHQHQPLRSMLDRSQLAAAFRHLGQGALLDAILEDLQQAGRIRLSERGVALAGAGPKLSQNERKLLGELIEVFRQAGIQSPSVQECQQRAARGLQSVPQLIALAAADGDLVEIAAGYYLHLEVDREIQTRVRQALAGGQGLTVSQLREVLNASRKYAVPYCEYLDRIGFTRRAGDLRYLAVRQP
jgi:selenocysteine-specific elongation factor